MDASATGYILSQWLFLKLLGLVYAIAFGSLLIQVDGLYGSRGILPIRDYLSPLKGRRKTEALRSVPSLFLLHCSDAFLRGCAAAGVGLSLLLVAGIFPALTLFLLWLLYLSFVAVGQEFLSYQWDALLLETGFMAIFFALVTPPPFLATAAWWFFLFRFVFSAGVVKLTSGDPTWRNLTALCHHYQTQPLPNRIAWYAHQLPTAVQKLSTLGTFFFELAVPFLVLGPASARALGFLLMVLFQGLILLTGSYGFFNLLTMVLAVPLLGDDHLAWLGAPASLQMAAPSGGALPWALSVVFALFLMLNLLQLIMLFTRPAWLTRMLVPLSRWGITAGYGLFAVMTTRRYEFTIEGSRDGRSWTPYHFRWKPGEPSVPPRQAAPHQPRLDWQMWFAALEPALLEPWLENLVLRLLEGSKPVLSLLKENPFGDAPPRYIRLVVYQYRFTDRRARSATGHWWQRDLIGRSPPITLPENAHGAGDT